MQKSLVNINQIIICNIYNLLEYTTIQWEIFACSLFIQLLCSTYYHQIMGVVKSNEEQNYLSSW